MKGSARGQKGSGFSKNQHLSLRVGVGRDKRNILD